jgi:hypothetical protein
MILMPVERLRRQKKIQPGAPVGDRGEAVAGDLLG